jgi:hypothetical protein
VGIREVELLQWRARGSGLDMKIRLHVMIVMILEFDDPKLRPEPRPSPSPVIGLGSEVGWAQAKPSTSLHQFRNRFMLLFHKDMLADIFTTQLPREAFEKFRKALGVREYLKISSSGSDATHIL